MKNSKLKNHVNNNRKIETKAWVGKTGQTEFKATIHFGQKILSKYAEEMDLTDCILDLESRSEWIDNKLIK